MTRRQEIIEMLRHRKLTVKEISDEFLTTPEEIVIELPYIRDTVRPQEKLVYTDPVCNTCGFIFRERKMQKPPTKCPKCKSHDISVQRYFIKKL